MHQLHLNACRMLSTSDICSYSQAGSQRPEGRIRWARCLVSIEQKIQINDEAYLQHMRECVEKPSMTVYLLLVLLLHAEKNLRRNNTLVRISEVQVGIKSKGGGILKEMSCYRLMIDLVYHMLSGLIHSQEGQTVQYSWMYFLATVSYNTHDHLCNHGINKA